MKTELKIGKYHKKGAILCILLILLAKFH